MEQILKEALIKIGITDSCKQQEIYNEVSSYISKLNGPSKVITTDKNEENVNIMDELMNEACHLSAKRKKIEVEVDSFFSKYFTNRQKTWETFTLNCQTTEEYFDNNLVNEKFESIKRSFHEVVFSKTPVVNDHIYNIEVSVSSKDI